MLQVLQVLQVLQDLLELRDRKDLLEGQELRDPRDLRENLVPQDLQGKREKWDQLQMWTQHSARCIQLSLCSAKYLHCIWEDRDLTNGS